MVNLESTKSKIIKPRDMISFYHLSAARNGTTVICIQLKTTRGVWIAANRNAFISHHKVKCKSQSKWGCQTLETPLRVVSVFGKIWKLEEWCKVDKYLLSKIFAEHLLWCCFSRKWKHFFVMLEKQMLLKGLRQQCRYLLAPKIKSVKVLFEKLKLIKF